MQSVRSSVTMLFTHSRVRFPWGLRAPQSVKDALTSGELTLAAGQSSGGFTTLNIQDGCPHLGSVCGV